MPCETSNYLRPVRARSRRGLPCEAFHREEIAAIGCDAVSIDWQTDMGEAKARIGDKVALQGNLDPAILLSNPGEITRQTENILRVFGEQKSGHVFNLGHGILPQTPVENVAHLVDVVHNSKDL